MPSMSHQHVENLYHEKFLNATNEGEEMYESVDKESRHS